MPTITPAGAPKPMSVLGYDGTNFYVLKTDGDGHLQIDALSTALPTDAATDTVLQAVRDRIGALTTPAAGSVNKLLTDALTALQLIDDLRNALDSVGTDELDVNVEASVLPTDAATQTTLASCLTALQLIDDLRGALESVATDQLAVTGQDQLISYKDSWLARGLAVISGANGYTDLATVTTDEAWHIGAVYFRNRSRNTTGFQVFLRRGATDYCIFSYWGTMIVNQRYGGQVDVWGKADDIIRIYNIGASDGDNCSCYGAGFTMTKES